MNQDMYLYRTSGRTLLVKMLNLVTMNKSFITIEIIWYAIQVLREPLCKYIDIQAKSYAKIL